MRTAPLALLVLACFAQDPTTFRSTVPLVIAPVAVTDREGQPVDGLQSKDFQLLVDGQPRLFDSDVTIQPVALVIAVMTGPDSAPALAKISRAGSMIQPLITGQRGVAAVLAYDQEIRILQDFTADPFAIGAAFERLSQSGSGGRMLDAAAQAIKMLRGRVGYRRVLLLIGESRDRGSESKLEDVFTDAQVDNVSIYTITWSGFLSAWAAKPGEAAPSGGMNLLALFSLIHRQAQKNTAEALAAYTGGRRFSFVRQNALEQAISAIGEELHSQYLLSFTPLAQEREGYHTIDVRVPKQRDVTVRTRPGYWLSTSSP
jgi:VWFA-related protein